MDWKRAPYYPRPDVAYVENATMSRVPGQTSKTITVESALQQELAARMSNILAWLNPNYNTFQTSRTVQSLMNDFIEQAQFRIGFFPSTGDGVDPIALGMQYGRLQMTLMQEIDSGDGATSLWDAWTRMKEPIK